MSLMLPDVLQRMPDIRELLPGIGVDNALEFVGKKGDRMTQKMVVDGSEPTHTTFWGSKLADRLTTVNNKLRKFRLANPGPFENDAQRDAVHNTVVKLSEEMKRLKIAHKLAQIVVMTGTLELPEIKVEVKEGDPSQGRVPILDKRVKVKRGDVITEKALLDTEPGIRLYWLDVWTSDMLKHVTVIGSGTVLAGA